MLIKAVAAALPAFPLMTGLLDGDQIHMLLKPGIGLAIDTPAGLVAPVVKGPIDKGLGEIASDVESLAEKAHAGELSVDDLQGGCITISNLGAMNIESFVPIVIPGQCSIMGVGRIADTLFPDNSGFAVRKTIKLTLAIDHRIANGAYAAQFLDHLKNILQDPKILAK
jgi:pyruvate dehydrogenase E2 component (dihydrolipoamide acetyltransferase)